MSIRSLKARLQRLTPPARPVIGEDVDRDLRRRQELGGRTYVPGLAAAEEAEYAELNESLKKEDEDSRRFRHLTLQDFESVHIDGEPLTDAERIELTELSKRHQPDGLLHSMKAWALAAAGKDLGCTHHCGRRRKGAPATVEGKAWRGRAGRPLRQSHRPARGRDRAP
jgi:hypothetical protein